MHNGALQVAGEKMSKSLGNFVTIRDLLDAANYGGRPWHGRVIRWALLTSHYRQPIELTVERLTAARALLMDFASLVGSAPPAAPLAEMVAALCDDLNTPSAMSVIHGIAKAAAHDGNAAAQLKASLAFLGVYAGETARELGLASDRAIDTERIEGLIAARTRARKARDFAEADRIRDELAAMGIALKDRKSTAPGEIETSWELKR
jgi:cysteinyl-tRNA synthetase